MTVIIAILFSACADRQSGTPATVGGQATVIVKGLDGELIASGAVELSSAVTAFDAFDAIITGTGLRLEYSGTGESTYITSVGGLAAGDEGDSSGWLFKVNGEMAEVGAGQYTLRDGDEALLYYTRDFMAEFE